MEQVPCFISARQPTVPTRSFPGTLQGKEAAATRLAGRGRSGFADHGTSTSLAFLALASSLWRSGRRTRRRAAAATDFDIDIIQKKKTGKKAEEEEETKTSKDMWVVLVHAPIRNCKMPWCKIPGLRRVICTCLKDGVEPGAGIRSKDGKCALTLEQYAEVLSEGVPLLSRGKAYEVSSRLFESAMANPVGTAVVVNSFKKAAEDYHQRLTNLGLWTSIAPMDRD
eukprot:symbB.v1.2.021025.t1/scaffold1798.1/size163522/4